MVLYILFILVSSVFAFFISILLQSILYNLRVFRILNIDLLDLFKKNDIQDINYFLVRRFDEEEYLLRWRIFNLISQNIDALEKEFLRDILLSSNVRLIKSYQKEKSVVVYSKFRFIPESKTNRIKYCDGMEIMDLPLDVIKEAGQILLISKFVDSLR